MKNSTKSEMLHVVIHQLSKAEKRLFRLEINKLKKGSDYSIVFDYLLNTKNYDELQFRQYTTTNKISSLLSSVGHLFDKLITFLTIQRSYLARSSKTRNKVEKMSVESETMHELNLIKQAHKTRKKALKLALENDLHELAVHSFEFLHLLEEKHKNLKLSSVDLVDKAPNVNVREHARLWAIQMELQILVKETFKLYNDLNTTEEDWKYILENPIFSLDSNTFNSYIKIMVLDIKANYQAWKLEFEKSIILTNEILAIFKESKRKFVSHFEYYLLSHYNLCYDLYRLNHPDLQESVHGFEQSLDEYKKLTLGSPVARMDNISQSHKIMNSTMQLRALLLQESFTLKDVDKWSTPQQVNLVLSNKFSLLVSSNKFAMFSIHASAYMYLILKEQEKFNEFKSILISSTMQLGDPVLEWELELLYLLDIYENENDQYFNNQLKNIIRKSKRNSNKYETVTYMFYLLAELRKTAFPKKVLEAALPEIEALETKSKLTTIYYSVWLRWRLKEYDINAN